MRLFDSSGTPLASPYSIPRVQNQELDMITGVAYVPSPVAASPDRPGGTMKVPRSVFAPSPGQQAQQQASEVDELKKELKAAEAREVCHTPHTCCPLVRP